MRHQQYKESMLLRLREWRLSNPEGTLTDARADLRKSLSSEDVDLLFDNWLNANFDRIELKEVRSGSVVAVIKTRGARDPERARKQAVIANKIVKGVRSNLFEEFAARIWDTPTPTGVALRNATGKDIKHASGWYGELAKQMKPTEKVIKKFTTRQLFNLSQRAM